VVREVRALIRELGVSKRKLEQLVATVQALKEGPPPKEPGAVTMASILPYMEWILQRSFLNLECAWGDLWADFTGRSLTKALRKAQGPRPRPAAPAKPERGSSPPPAGGRRRTGSGERGKSGGRGK
jgi:hypothetical protein